MIDRNRSIESQELKTHVIAGMTSGILLQNLVVRNKPTRIAVASTARAIISLQDSGLDLSAHGREYGTLFNIAGRAAYEEKDYHAAELALAQAMELRATDVDSRFRLGVIRMCMGDPKGAERALYGASIASLMHLDGIYELGRLAHSHGRSTSGLELAAAEITQRSADILQALGESRLAQGNYGPAARAFEKCLKLDDSRDDVGERLQIAYTALAQNRFTN